MKKRTAFGVASAFVGTMIGAGFASGQEILQFFGGFGLPGLIGILVAGLFYVVYAALIMLLARQMNTDNYNLLIVPGENKVLLVIVDILMAFLLFGMFSAMVVGSSSLLTEQLGWHPLIGALIMVAISILTVYWGSDSLVASFNIVVPIMIVSATVIGIASIVQAPSVEFYDVSATLKPNPMVGNWFLSAMLFVFYSMLGGVGSLASLGLELEEDKDAVVGATMGGVTLGLIAVLLFVAMMSHVGEIAGAPMPMLNLAQNVLPLAGYVYTFVLFAAIYTTAAGALFAIKARVDHIDRLSPGGKNIAIIVVAVVALLATRIGFVSLVGTLYPLYGYMGMLIFVGMVVNFVITRKNGKKQKTTP